MVDLLVINTEAEEPEVETASNSTTETDEKFAEYAERELRRDSTIFLFTGNL